MRDKLNRISHYLLCGNGTVAAFLVIVAVGLAAYLRSFYADFQFDDYHAIVNNPIIRDLDLPILWDIYKERFLTYLTFAVNYSIGGLNVFGWHAVNFLIHVIASFFAYKLTHITLRRCQFDSDESRITSLFVALVFLVHPIQTQAVTYIVQRAMSLVSLFCLAAVYCYAVARIEKRETYFLWVMLCFVAGMTTKPTVISLPFIILLYDICFIGDWPENIFTRIFIGFFMFLPIVIVAFVFIGKNRLAWMATIGPNAIPQPQYLFTQFNVILTYIRLLFLPVNQNIDYDYSVAGSMFEFPTSISFLAIVAILVGACIAAKKYRLLSFGVFWFFIAISPQSSIFPLRDVIYEHRLYLGCYGFAVFICILLYMLCRNRKVFYSVMCFVVGLLAITTYQRNVLWSDAIVFARDVARKSPNKARPHNNLGFFYFKNGEFEKAESEYERALECDPDYFVARANLAILYLKQEKPAQAQRHFEMIIERYPNYAKAYEGLGQIFAQRGNSYMAFRFFQKAITLDVYNSAARIGLGNMYEKMGYLLTAKSEFQKAIHYNPHSAVAHYSLGNIYFKEGKFDEALDSYRRAISLKSDFTEALHNAGNVFLALGDYENAIKYYKETIVHNSSLAEVHFNLANALHAVGRVNEAQQTARKSAELYRAQEQTNRADQIEGKLMQQQK